MYSSNGSKVTPATMSDPPTPSNKNENALPAGHINSPKRMYDAHSDKQSGSNPATARGGEDDDDDENLVYSNRNSMTSSMGRRVSANSQEDENLSKVNQRHQDDVGERQRARKHTLTLRLDKEEEEKLMRIKNKGNFISTTLSKVNQQMHKPYSNQTNDKRKKEADVQKQIEKYVENLCQIYSKGTGGRADHVQLEHWVLYPDSAIRVYWDFTLLLLIVWSAFYVPFNITFGQVTDDSVGIIIFGFIIDSIFIVDVALNFFTGYKDGPIIVTDRKKVATRYLQTWFIIDFIASIPIDRFTADRFRSNKLLRMVRLAKLFRLARLLRYSDSLRSAIHMQPSVVRLTQQMFGVIWAWHVICCIYYQISTDKSNDNTGEWGPLPAINSEEDSTFFVYMQCYLWAVTTTFSLRLPARPRSAMEVGFSLCVVVAGIGMSSLVIGTAASALASMDAEAIRKRRSLDKVVRYMKKRKLPNYFQRIIVDFHEYMVDKPSQEEIMSGLPDPIKLRLSLLLNRDLVKDIPMLKQLPLGPIIALMQKLSSEIYLPGEFTITAGDIGGFMYFVRSGEMDLLLDDNATIIKSLKEGDIFGHIALIETLAHDHSVRAVKYSEVTSLDSRGFQAICLESERFEELITSDAILQEQLISAAKKNVERFTKLTKMGGEAGRPGNSRVE